MNKFRIITGNAKEVESELNKLNKTYWVLLSGMSATNETTTVMIELNDRINN